MAFASWIVASVVPPVQASANAAAGASSLSLADFVFYAAVFVVTVSFVRWAARTLWYAHRHRIGSRTSSA